MNKNEKLKARTKSERNKSRNHDQKNKSKNKEQEWKNKWSRVKQNHRELANMKQRKNKCKQHQNKKWYN